MKTMILHLNKQKIPSSAQYIFAVRFTSLPLNCQFVDNSMQTAISVHSHYTLSVDMQTLAV